jgi:hypothetical protein
LLELLSQKFMWEREGILGARVLQVGGREILSEIFLNLTGVSKKTKILLKTLLTVDAIERPSAREILKLQILKNFRPKPEKKKNLKKNRNDQSELDEVANRAQANSGQSPINSITTVDSPSFLKKQKI